MHEDRINVCHACGSPYANVCGDPACLENPAIPEERKALWRELRAKEKQEEDERQMIYKARLWAHERDMRRDEVV